MCFFIFFGTRLITEVRVLLPFDLMTAQSPRVLSRTLSRTVFSTPHTSPPRLELPSAYVENSVLDLRYLHEIGID